MPDNIIPFEFEGVPVRVVIIDGEPYWVGKDVADRLGYVDSTNAMKQHCRGVAKHHPILDAIGRKQNARVLSESDVLRLVVSSNLPEAERFERWLFEEVLPSIRKTGSYRAGATPGQVLVDLDDPASLRDIIVNYANRLEKSEVEKSAAVAENAVLAPKAEALDRIATIVEGSMCIRDTAKNLQMRPIDLKRYFLEKKWVYLNKVGRMVAYQTYLNSGLLEHKYEPIISKTTGAERMATQVCVTGKGLAKLSLEMHPQPNGQLPLL